jgi:hypothetical protein
LANWWDSVALWLSDLAFPIQFALVIAVLAPVCFVLAWGIDNAVDLVTARFQGTPGSPQPTVPDSPRTPPLVVHVRADVPAGTPATIITSVRTEPTHPGEPADATVSARVDAGVSARSSAGSDAVHS